MDRVPEVPALAPLGEHAQESLVIRRRAWSFRAPCFSAEGVAVRATCSICRTGRMFGSGGSDASSLSPPECWQRRPKNVVSAVYWPVYCPIVSFSAGVYIVGDVFRANPQRLCGDMVLKIGWRFSKDVRLSIHNG
ncbi:MAG: hypothetical protein U0894_15330 [Pirellulales bacterium]